MTVARAVDAGDVFAQVARPGTRKSPEGWRDGLNENAVTILIIDNDAASRSELARLLTRVGLEVAEAAHGEDGMRAAAERPAAVILEVALRTSTASSCAASFATSTGTTSR
jgi:PleD family two-component response regulator